MNVDDELDEMEKALEVLKPYILARKVPCSLCNRPAKRIHIYTPDDHVCDDLGWPHGRVRLYGLCQRCGNTPARHALIEAAYRRQAQHG